MVGRSAAGRNRPRWGIVALAVVLLLSAAGADPADAARRHKRHFAKAGGGYNPPYAAIVVDANSGEVLHATNADSTRHPASICSNSR